MPHDQRYYPVADNPSLVKDGSTGALLNKDVTALEAYKTRKAAASKTNNTIKQLEENYTHLESKIDKIESQLTEIKDILTQIAGKLNR